MLPENDRLGRPAGRAGDCEIFAQDRVVGSLGLEEKTRLVGKIFREDGQIQWLGRQHNLEQTFYMPVNYRGFAIAVCQVSGTLYSIHSYLLCKVIGCLTCVQAGAGRVDLQQQQVFQVDQLDVVGHVERVVVLVPLDDGGRLGLWRVAGKDHIVAHIGLDVCGGGDGGKLVEVGYVQCGRVGHQQHVLQASHADIATSLTVVFSSGPPDL